MHEKPIIECRKQRERERQTLDGASIRKHALQLQFIRQTGQASAKASSDILGYLVSGNRDERELKLKKQETLIAACQNDRET